MPIEFSYNHEGRYLLVTYAGKILPGEVPASWTAFIENDYEELGYNLLSDLSRADLSDVPLEDVEKLTEVSSRFYGESEISSIKVATYAPKLLNYGMARAYEGMAIGSVEKIRTFRSLEDARAWLAREDEPSDPA